MTRSSRRLGPIVAGALAAGLATASVLVISPFVAPTPTAMAGAVLSGFGLGWALIALLCSRFTDQPQRWTAAPALLMGLGGLLLLVVPGFAPVLDWVWPPVTAFVAVWVAVRAKSQLRSRSERWLVLPLIALLALAALGGGYTTAQSAIDARSHPMPGQLVDLGDHRLHLNCAGTGTPTVILEPGAGAASSTFGWIAPAVARETRVCVYDRAGRGWSDPTRTPQDANQIATDLHELLTRAQIPGPYVLAGHSFGGLYVLTFAALYPDEVAGLALVDSTAATSPAQASMPADGSDALTDRLAALIAASARLGWGQMLGWLNADGLPTQSAGEVRAHAADSESVLSTIEEYRQGAASMAQAATLTTLGDKPLMVLTAGVGHDTTWLAAQQHLALLSTNSTQRVALDATHETLISDGQQAAVTTEAILDVVSAVRYHRRMGT